MTKSAVIRACTDPALKTQTEGVLKEFGLSTSELISITFRQVVMCQGLPFEARIPNVETMAAIEEFKADRTAGRDFLCKCAKAFYRFGFGRKRRIRELGV